MLLFVCNGTDQSSILSDTRQMPDLAYDDIETNGMMPEEFNNKDIPEFTLRVNVPRLPSNGKKSNNKVFNYYSNQGKKAFYFEVAKEDLSYFKYLLGHAHRLQLDNKFFSKFAKFTTTLGSNAPMSDCVSLRRCIQGHLNFTSAPPPSGSTELKHLTQRKSYETWQIGPQSPNSHSETYSTASDSNQMPHCSYNLANAPQAK